MNHYVLLNFKKHHKVIKGLEATIMKQDNKNLKNKLKIVKFFKKLIFGNNDPSSLPIIRGIGHAPKLLRPGQSLPLEKKDTEIH